MQTVIFIKDLQNDILIRLVLLQINPPISASSSSCSGKAAWLNNDPPGIAFKVHKVAYSRSDRDLSETISPGSSILFTHHVHNRASSTYEETNRPGVASFGMPINRRSSRYTGKSNNGDRITRIVITLSEKFCKARGSISRYLAT